MADARTPPTRARRYLAQNERYERLKLKETGGGATDQDELAKERDKADHAHRQMEDLAIQMKLMENELRGPARGP